MSEWLHALPVLPPELPDLDVEALPADPGAAILFRLRLAVDAGARAPHAVTLATASPAGGPTARTVMLRDVTGTHLVFASRDDGPKARDLAADPRAAVVMLWPETGDQVRVTGTVRDLGDDAAAADLAARGEFSLASTLVDGQSEPIPDRATHAAEHAHALARARDGETSPHWRAYGLEYARVELWHSSRAGQVRVLWTRAADGWARALLRP